MNAEIKNKLEKGEPKMLGFLRIIVTIFTHDNTRVREIFRHVGGEILNHPTISQFGSQRSKNGISSQEYMAAK